MREEKGGDDTIRNKVKEAGDKPQKPLSGAFGKNDNEKMAQIVAIVVLSVASIWYSYYIYFSTQKWFHFAIIGMIAFGSIQMHQFYLNKTEIDAKIELLRQKQQAVSLSRETSVNESSSGGKDGNSPVAIPGASLAAEPTKQEDLAEEDDEPGD